MGACGFTNVVTGRSAKEAFRAAVDNALHESGHGGYTGTIAEKAHDGFGTVTPPSDEERRSALAKVIAEKEQGAIRQSEQAAKDAAYFATTEVPAWKEDAAAQARRKARTQEQADKTQAEIDKLKAMLADTKSPIPLDLVAYEFLDEWMGDKEDKDGNFVRGRYADKHGPAGCLVLAEPTPIQKMTKAKAEALAKEKYGPDVVIETERRNKQTTATIWRDVPGGRSGLRRSTAADADEARGGLFAEPGKYLFFGYASM